MVIICDVGAHLRLSHEVHYFRICISYLSFENNYATFNSFANVNVISQVQFPQVFYNIIGIIKSNLQKLELSIIINKGRSLIYIIISQSGINNRANIDPRLDTNFQLSADSRNDNDVLRWNTGFQHSDNTGKQHIFNVGAQHF